MAVDAQHTLSLSSGNEFVPNEIARIIGGETRKRKSAHTWYFYKKEDDSRFLSKDFDEEYDLLLTQTRCGDKYIPDIYKTASIEQRWLCFRDCLIQMDVLKIKTASILHIQQLPKS